MGLKKSSEISGLRRVEERAYPRDAEGLIAQLSDADPAVRRWAARDLAAFDEATPWLCARLTDEPDAAVRAVLFTSLAQMGQRAVAGDAVVQGALPLLRSEDAGLRNAAIELLAALPEAVEPHIDALLRDGDSDVRIFSVNLLGDLPHAKVPQWLAHVLVNEQAVNVVGAALEVMAEVGGRDAASAVQTAKARFASDAYITFAADLALTRIEAS